MAAKKSSFEEKLNRLQEIANALEKGELSLEEMLKAFEEGIKVYRECNTILESTEAKIQMLMTEE
ncbi:MAG: exodeoxyribonuclease VII small subunit [Clostridia bacterium]|jgi:exodeoxyribonuclease VII small subunit|nr:exodeoxyribonuclease VII small subunit [Clostridia bacterium]